MMIAVGLLFLLAATASTAHARKRYDGYKLFDVMPTNKETLAVLHELMMTNIHVDFWKEPSQLNKLVTFMVKPEFITPVMTRLRRGAVDYQLRGDVEELMGPLWDDIDRRQALKESADTKMFNLNEFNNLIDLYDWMKTDLVASCRAGLICEVYSVGYSFEGRAINVFKISTGAADRKAYWLDATIHAREWITTATIQNLMDIFARGANAEAIRLTDSYDWYFLPVMNPDGYAYTWSDERLWRKNRRLSSEVGSVCRGIDLNRNFAFRWGEDGVSFDACAENYCGSSAGSEQETQYVSNELVRLGPTLKATVTLHAYGNMWMFPWGNTVNFEGTTCDLAEDNADLMMVADATANAIEVTYNTTWTRGNSCEVIYATTGGTDDYSKGAAGVKYAFCPELRGDAFVLLPREIEYSFTEIFNGLVVMVDTIGV
jgi:carboxypeptidase A2